MRELRVAESAGFCFGVQRSVEMAEKLLEILHAEPFKKELRHLSGNDYRDMGRIIAEV